MFGLMYESSLAVTFCTRALGLAGVRVSLQKVNMYEDFLPADQTQQ